ncbi:unnamed protein product [Mytilus coruscus]|uniref:B box-type domain-containing protein n=1 Tax=Mytilus coruscus TaxID=42192 RepID=A0A6J8CEW9_MYTCO|nr:unnamed protein product [Mytilus coruscus]
MAFSLPVYIAQTPASCQFCEVSSDIQWKCINCNLFLCRLCTSKIHSKIKSIDEHEIISLKEIGTDDAANSHRKINLQTIPCAVHEDQICCVYCRHCQQPVCSRCLTQTHQHHKYRELKDVYKEKYSDIRELYQTVEIGIPSFLDEESMLQDMLSLGEREFEENKAKIIQQKEYLKEVVTKHSERLLKNLEEQWWKNKYAISKKLDITTQGKDKLVSERDHLEEVLQSHQSLDILNATIDSEKCLPEIESTSVNLQHIKFIPRALPEQDIIKKILGSICNVPYLQLAHTYQTNLERVEKVIICDTNTTYIGGVKDKLQKVKFHEDNLMVEYEVNLSVYDMVPFKNGNILISSEENDLKLVSTDGKVSSFKNFSPLKTLCVHVSDQNLIYLGLVGPQNSTTVDVRKVVVLDVDGDIHHNYEYDRNNKRLFTRPHRITTYKNCMVIIDLEKFGGRVIFLHPGGYIVWDYIGCGYPDFEEIMIEFDPRDLSVSSADIILISDYNHAIHFLNLDGQVISVCDISKEFGIEFPFCTYIDKKETLWVSGQNLENEVAEIFGLHIK